MKKVLLSLLLSSLVLMTSGCWDHRELNELGIVVAAAVDLEDHDIKLTSQIVLPSAVASGITGTTSAGGRTPTLTITTTGKTMMDAMLHTSKESPRRYYFAHSRVMLIGEEMARSGIKPIVNYLMRDSTVRETTEIVIVHGKASDLLRMITVQEKIPANEIIGVMDVDEAMLSNQWKVPLYELAGKVAKKPSDFVIPVLGARGDVEKQATIDALKEQKAKARIYAEGIAVFKRDRLVGWLTDEQGKGLGWFLNKIKGSVLDISIKSPKSDSPTVIAYGVKKASIKKQVVVKNDKITIILHVKSEGEIGSIRGELNLIKPGVVEEVEQLIDGKIKEQMEVVLKIAQQKYRSDIVGFGQLIYEHEPKTWHKIESRWDAIFPSVDVVIQVDSQIQKAGMINNNLGTPLQ